MANSRAVRLSRNATRSGKWAMYRYLDQAPRDAPGRGTHVAQGEAHLEYQMATRTSRQSNNRPPVDEWGIYDPSQAGLEAVLGRLSMRAPTSETDGRRIAAAMEEVKRLAQTRADSKKA